MNIKVITGVLVVAGLLLAKASMFIVTEGNQAIITEFGAPVGEPISSSGLYFKTPFIQEIRYVDKRILNWDGYPSEIPTKDKKYIKVDTTARWRIVDVLKFIQTVRNEIGAKARLDAILDATTRDIISNNNLVEAVRNSNAILDKIEEAKKAAEELKKRGEIAIEEEIIGEVEKIELGREKLSELIVVEADKELIKFGIKLIDVQLRRISYEKSVEKKVYERMISERQKVAQKIKSIGLGERSKIEGRTQRELKQIESESYRTAQTILGKADAESTALFARALSNGKDFYEFQRSLEAYRKTFSNKIKLLISNESSFLKYLNKPK